MDSNEAGSSKRKEIDEDENEELVQMSDVVKHHEELTEYVTAVLGAGDDTNCTYSLGYLNRQALYACLTCIPEASLDYTKSAGVCLACSYNCHDGHNLVELYTKRNFRCDCGNKKFTDFTCNLHKDKDDFNSLNKYNHNFSGVYCTCSKPYPDPEETIEDEMIQCVVCEDWFHSRHLGVPPPANYAEMICEACVLKHDFLLHYEGLMVTVVTNSNNDTTVDIDGPTKEDDSIKENKESESSQPNTTESPSDCQKPKNKSNVSSKFFEDVTWREKLCKCPVCLKLYEDISFLSDLQDTIQVYAEKGKQKVEEKQVESQAQLFNSLDRIALVEFLSGYNEFKEELSDFLHQFANKKQVIRVKDVEDFFADIRSKKRVKLDMSYHCR